MKARNKERAGSSISAVLKFSQTGRLHTIYLNANSERDQVILQKGLRQLLRPGWFERVKGMFTNGK